MFSDHAQAASRAEGPKNGPVPGRSVNGYEIIWRTPRADAAFIVEPERL
jgi:hypothetical protein